MVGPGTGVAPMRSILRERIHMSEGCDVAEAVLFFGCRRREQDDLYGAEWLRLGFTKLQPRDGNNGEPLCGDAASEKRVRTSAAQMAPLSVAMLMDDTTVGWPANGQFSVSTAYSQDQSHKVYVTDKIRAHGAYVWELIKRGGIVFVSGSAKKMPLDVKKAISDVIATHGQLTVEETAAYIGAMERGNRYIVEVWT